MAGVLRRRLLLVAASGIVTGWAARAPAQAESLTGRGAVSGSAEEWPELCGLRVVPAAGRLRCRKRRHQPKWLVPLFRFAGLTVPVRLFTGQRRIQSGAIPSSSQPPLFALRHLCPRSVKDGRRALTEGQRTRQPPSGGGHVRRTMTAKGVATSDAHRNFVGRISVRHICATGLLSKPSPSFGCLKLRPMISVNSSSSTTTSGSNE